MPDRAGNSERSRISQDVASLAATVRKVEAEQTQLAGAINALSSKFDSLADRIANLGRPNYQAAGFIAAILMAFGGLVWNFIDNAVKENTEELKKLIATEHAQEVEANRFLGGADERMEAAEKNFELYRARTMAIDDDYNKRLLRLEIKQERLLTESERNNLDVESFSETVKDVASIKERLKIQSGN